jgi:hypothetical protein
MKPNMNASIALTASPDKPRSALAKLPNDLIWWFSVWNSNECAAAGLMPPALRVGEYVDYLRSTRFSDIANQQATWTKSMDAIEAEV